MRPINGLNSPRCVVVHEQLLGQRRLVIEHVDQEAECADVVAELLESAGRVDTLLVDFGDDDLFDRLAHAQDGLRGLVQAQHRQHAAHLRKVAGRVAQRRLVLAGRGRTGPAASRARPGCRAVRPRRCPWSGGRSRGGTAPPSNVPAACAWPPWRTVSSRCGQPRGAQRPAAHRRDRGRGTRPPGTARRSPLPWPVRAPGPARAHDRIDHVGQRLRPAARWPGAA